MRPERVGEAPVTVPVGVEPVGGEERLTARAEDFVDPSPDFDVDRARG